jgi:phospholipid/cholesterol/gamma-HCH transport system substrate-binding protein/paraquat-inducible protein B
MSAEARYFRVGIFVFIGILLIGSCAVILGGQQLLSKPVVFETYFDESVQGLEVGSPVKIRGVQIGSVSEIGLVEDYYTFDTLEKRLEHGTKIRVKMELDLAREDPEKGMERKPGENLKYSIERGLRVRLTSQGITGTSFIGADFMSPEDHPPMEIVWTPRHLYVPSAASTMKTISTAAERIFEKLEDVEIEKVVRDLDTLLLSLNKTVEEIDARKFQTAAVGLVEELRATNARLQHTIDGGRYDFEVALQNLRVASENLRDLSATAREYPSLMILGEPPQPAKGVSR